MDKNVVSQPIKICYYNHTGKISGAEKILFTLLANVGPGFETSLIAPSNAELLAFCRQHGITHLGVDELRARFTMNPLLLVKYVGSALRGIWQVRRQVRRAAPDIVHANSTRAGMVASIATVGNRTPVVWHIHDQLKKHPITAATGFLLRSSCRNSVVAVSRATAEGVRGIADSRVPITVVHNGVDCALYDPRPEEIERFLQKENLSESTFRVAMVGQITPRKGQLEAIQTFARFVKTNTPRAQLLVVGKPVFNRDDLYHQRLLDEVRRLGIEHNVRFLGQRADIPVILRSVHMLMMNSSSEPFSVVLLEACASATPVLASAVDGVPELIIDGETGRLFRYGDADAMLLGLRQMESDRNHTKALGLAARERAARYFSQDRFLREIRQLYLNVVSSPSAA
jgi:L-malate glycosyltransferase